MGRRVCAPSHELGDRLDRLERPHARSLVLAMGLGSWDLYKRAKRELEDVAFVVRYSHGGATWDEAKDTPTTELARRVQALVKWIRVENTPSK